MYLLGPLASRTYLVHSSGMAPKQTDPQFKLRLPPDIKEALEEAARRNNRSMSAEIVARLAESIRYDEKSVTWDSQIEDLHRKTSQMQADIDALLKMKK